MNQAVYYDKVDGK